MPAAAFHAYVTGVDMQALSTAVWQNIRLELAPMPEFPKGSATRAYLLHLPLREGGTIDELAFLNTPAMATFKRFWPNEPDRAGQVVRTESGWALCFQPARDDSIALFPIELDRLLPGEEVTIEKHGGGRWTFRVADLKRAPSA